MITLCIILYVVFSIGLGLSEMKDKTHWTHGMNEKGKPFWSAMGFGFFFTFLLIVAAVVFVGLVILGGVLLLAIIGGLTWIGTHMP